MNPTHANVIAADFESVVQRLEGRRVMPCEWQGLPAFAKRLYRRRPLERALLMSFAPVLRAWLVGNFAFKPARRDSPRDFEITRLLELREAGERVPRVLAWGHDAFIVESVGLSLEQLLLRSRRVALRQGLVARAAEDLARFHLRGHWHGGAQVRNVGVTAQGLARFDFDRDLDRHFPLPILQALDALLFLSSLQRLRDESMLRLAASCYFGVAPPSVIAVIQRAAPALVFLARSRVVRAVSPKEAARLTALTSALTLLGPCSSSSGPLQDSSGAVPS